MIATRAAFLPFALLAACVVESDRMPPPRSAQQPAPPPPVVVAPPPPAVAATEPTVVIAPPPPVIAAPPDGRYPIQLERRAVAGSVFRVHIRGTKTIRKETRIAGHPPQSETEQLSIDLTGMLRVSAADEQGDATRLDIQVEQCRTERASAPEALLSPGTVLTVESALEPATGRFLVGGAEPDPRLAEYLEIVFDRSHQSTSDDAAFGTPVPRRVGESWPANTAVIAAGLAGKLPGLTPADVRARVTFHGLADQLGTASLDLGVLLQLRVRAMPNLPPGTVVDRGDMRIETRGLFPRDPSIPSLRDRLTLTMHARLRIPTAAGTATMTMEIEQEKELERTPVR